MARKAIAKKDPRQLLAVPDEFRRTALAFPDRVKTATKWWQQAAKAATVACLTSGRVKSYNAAGEGSSPTNGQSFLYFGDRGKTFVKVFQNVGLCMEAANGSV